MTSVSKINQRATRQSTATSFLSDENFENNIQLQGKGKNAY